MKTLAIYLLALTFIGIASYSQPSKAPVSSEFMEYQARLGAGAVQNVTSDGHSLGYIPRPNPPVFQNPKKMLKSDKLMTEPPSSYDLRTLGYVTSVKDQSICGSCWAFASMGPIESNWLKNGSGTYDLSENNLKNCHGFYSGPCDGGNSDMSSAYLTRVSGPAAESADTYYPYTQSCTTGLTPQNIITKAVYLPNRDIAGYETILKNMIMQYGAIFTSLYMNNSYYNSTNYCYRYTGSAAPNHAVSLVGWDNNKTVTVNGATTTGAWILKNSWGTSWGESGYFYAAYNDTKVNSELTMWPEKMDYNSSRTLFYYDECGLISSVGWGSTTCYGLIKFTPVSDILLDRISSWIVNSSTSVTVQVYDNFSGGALSGLLGSINTQTCDYPGYCSFELSSPITIQSGNDFYIKVQYTTPSNAWQLPIEEVISNYCNPTIQSNVCWVSNNGTSWMQIGSNTDNRWDLGIRAYGCPATTISSGTISGSPFCPGASLSVPFTASGSYNQGNVYTAQLSNSSGNFDNPVTIGTLSGTSSGSISCTIPMNTPAGTGYRIRVIASDPSTIGCANSSDLTVIAGSKQISLTVYLMGLWNGSAHIAGVPLAIELRSGGTNLTTSSVISRKPCLINSSGVISALFDDVSDGNYYVVVRAAGYLPVAIPSQITLPACNEITYNFTSASAQSVNGTNVMINSGNYWLVRSGDFNWDRWISTVDLNSYNKPNYGKNSKSSIPAP
ncbi:MAG: type sorting protein [Bacteroidota bacterium]|nr:type sorting protein [Bacteroidota bacterium]